MDTACESVIYSGPSSKHGQVFATQIQCRRYRCTACDAVISVLPRGLAPAFRYALAAIAIALASWIEPRATAISVRERVGAGSHAHSPRRWSSLARWARSWRRLWPALVLDDHAPTARELARRIVFALRGWGEPIATASMRAAMS